MQGLPPPDAAAVARALDRALQTDDDTGVRDLKELERAVRALPPLFDGVRPVRLLHTDPLATTWEAWDVHTGRRCLVRCLRPAEIGDRRMRDRLGARLRGVSSSPALGVGTAKIDGDWPHVRLDIDGVPVSDLLPTEEPAEARWASRLLGRGLGALEELESHGVQASDGLPALLQIGVQGPRLAWLGHSAPGRPPIEALSTLLLALDEGRGTPAGHLAAGWLEAPPPSLADAQELLRSELARVLLDHRHALARRSRARDHHDRATRLAGLVARLRGAMAPPVARACLRVDARGPLTLLVSDGHTVRGGVSDRLELSELPVIYAPSEGLRAPAHRPLLRAWATRRGGDAQRRASVQDELGSSNAEAEALVRWLSAQARLRAALGLLRAEQRASRPLRRVGAR